MTNNKQYLLDLENAKLLFDGLYLNAFSIFNELRNTSDIPVIILLLLFKESYFNNSFKILPLKKYLSEGNYKNIGDFAYVYLL